MSAHYGAQVTDVPGFALDWYATLYDGDMRTAWARMDDNFRRCITQFVLTPPRQAGENVEPLADALSQRQPSSRHAERFLSEVRRLLVEEVASNRAPDELLAGQTVRAGGALLEVVRLYLEEDAVITAEGPGVAPDTWARALTVLVSVQTADPADWEIAGLGYLLEPGWPPKIGWQPPAEI